LRDDTAMRTIATARRALDAEAELAEGPRWTGSELLWVDIERGLVHAGDETIEMGSKVGAVAPIAGGGLLAALADRVVVVGGETVAALPHARPGMRSNDGACDPAGRFWIGTMAEDESPGVAALYRLDHDGSLHEMLSGVGMSNGIGWSPDARRMYYIDSLEHRVDVFDFDLARGAISGRRPFAAIEEAIPDGLAVDDEGGVWVALHGGGVVRRYLPDGTLDGIVSVPVAEVTACCFAGSRLFVTARPGVFAAEVGVRGPAATPYG
jgi:sugar lactone lactonase YvrE